jgi:very-short-patch-repair endonuclease
VSHLEDTLLLQMRMVGLPEPRREYCFCLDRRWRFDFAFPDANLAVEVEGATWVNGRHSRGNGFEKDCAKYNTAALLGWRVLKFTGGMIGNGEAITVIEKMIKCEKEEEYRERGTLS